MNIGTLTATLGINSNLGKIRAEMLAFQRDANVAFSQINAKLNDMNTRAGSAATTIGGLSRESRNFLDSLGPLTTATANVNTFANSLSNTATMLDKVGRNVYYFGTAATRFLTLPITLAGVAAFKMAKDFEYSMQKIVGLVGISQTQVNQWSKDLLKLGPELGRAPNDLAEALYYITSSGYKSSQALDILKTSAIGASAGVGTTAEVANVATSAMNAYRKSNLTSARAIDILIAAVREGKAEGADFAKQIGDVIPIASKVNVGFDQVAAAMAAITLTGSSTAEAATYVKNALFAITKPAPQATEALKKMGFSITELRNSISTQGLLPSLVKLGQLTNKYGEDLMAKVFPNIRGFLGVLSLLGDRVAENVELFKAVTNSTGDTQKAFEAMRNTLEFQYNKALSTVKSSMIEFLLINKDKIIPVITQVADTIKNVTSWYINLSESHRSLILNTGLLLAAVGPLAIGVGLLMRAFSGILTVVTTLIPVMKAFYVVMAANPWTALITIVGGYLATLYMFSRETEVATAKQKQFNEELERGKTLQGETQSIEKRMAVLHTMNAYQLQMTKEQIEAQKRLEETYAVDLAAKLADAIKNDAQLLDLQKQYNSTSSNEVKAFLAHQAQMRKEDIAKDLEVQYQANQKRLKELNAFLGQVDSLLKSKTPAQKLSVGPAADPKDLAKINRRVLDEYNASLKNLKRYGDDYITISQNIKDATGRTKYISVSKFDMPEFDTGPIDNYREHFMRLADSGGTLQKMLADSAVQTAMFGDIADASSLQAETLANQITIVKNAMETLVQQGMRPGNDTLTLYGMTLDDYIEKLKLLQAEQLKLNKVSMRYNEIQKGIMELAQSSIGSFRDFLNVLKEIVKNTILAIIAEAVAMNVLNAVKGSKSWWGAIIQGALAAAATTALFDQVIPKFAEGGVVPKGYPNDTYPALLSSDEVVTPPGKLDMLQNQTSPDEGGEVIFRIDGYELVGLMKKFDHRTSKV